MFEGSSLCETFLFRRFTKLFCSQTVVLFSLLMLFIVDTASAQREGDPCVTSQPQNTYAPHPTNSDYYLECLDGRYVARRCWIYNTGVTV